MNSLRSGLVLRAVKKILLYHLHSVHGYYGSSILIISTRYATLTDGKLKQVVISVNVLLQYPLIQLGGNSQESLRGINI